MKKKLMTSVLAGAISLSMCLSAFAGTWLSNSNGWYWQNDDGSHYANEWQWIDGDGDGVSECYYFDGNGYCLINTMTPDGYMVDNSGAWVVNGEPQRIGSTVNPNQAVQKKNQTIPTNAYYWGGHYYYLYPNGTCNSWEAAKAYCEDAGGHLAVISSKAEDDALFSYIKSRGYSTAYFGYSDPEGNFIWEWVPGEYSTYENWGEGEPNSKNEPYGQYYYVYPGGEWNDARWGDGGTAFICEWDPS